MATSQRISSKQIYEIQELVARVMEVGHNPAHWRWLAIDGLKRMLQAQVGLTLDVRLTDHTPVMVDPIDVGWQTDSVRRRYGEYVESGEMARDPGGTTWLAEHSKHRYVCRTRRELVDDRRWYGSASVSEARKLGDVDDFVVSSIAIRPDAIHGIIIYRSWSEKCFERRHLRLLNLFHLQLARADRVAQRRRQELVEKLPPRLQQTLEMLFSPLSLKEIARELGISRHTVNDYQKRLYERFEVTSRVELIYRLGPTSMRRLRFPSELGLEDPLK